MHCRSVQQLLHNAFDGTLASQEQRDIDTHLAGCQVCQLDALLLRVVVEALETAPIAQPSTDFTISVLDRLPAPTPLFGFLPVAVFRFAAAVVGAISVTLGWLYRENLVGLTQQTTDATLASVPGAALYQAYGAIQAFGYRILDYIPVQQWDSPQWSPITSVLIAVAIGMVILHMVNGFESMDEEMDWELEPTPDQA